MADNATHNAVSSSLASIEANVVIAGVEIVTGCWLLYRTSVGQSVVPHFAEWHWSFAFYAIVGFLGFVIAGLALEGVAGLIERVITRWQWVRNYTKLPDPRRRTEVQRWLWKSAQAYQDFSRRRLRMLVARNTATVILLFTPAWPVAVSWSSSVSWSSWWPMVVCVLGLPASMLFAYVWLDAQKGWNMAVSIAEQLGEP